MATEEEIEAALSAWFCGEWPEGEILGKKGEFHKRARNDMRQALDAAATVRAEETKTLQTACDELLAKYEADCDEWFAKYEEAAAERDRLNAALQTSRDLCDEILKANMRLIEERDAALERVKALESEPGFTTREQYDALGARIAALEEAAKIAGETRLGWTSEMKSVAAGAAAAIRALAQRDGEG